VGIACPSGTIDDYGRVPMDSSPAQTKFMKRPMSKIQDDTPGADLPAALPAALGCDKLRTQFYSWRI
jgi:hypothetical protein